MATKRSAPQVGRAACAIGAHLSAWRRMHNLTAQQVAERADISRDTLRRLEHGDPGVTLGSMLSVLRALGALDRVIHAVDPYETDLGRARAAMALPKRIRH
jgi:transcriptional regulator with XRE-family HTH domain